MTSFALKTGMSVTCSGIWNSKSQKYESSDSTQIAKCCLDECKHSINFCRKYCHDNNKHGQEFESPILMKSCLNKCEAKRESCIDTCRLITPYVGVNNNYIQCANKFGCRGLNDLPDPECVKKNKESIFKCCRHTCIPMKDLDCQSHCEFLQSVTIDADKVGIPKLNKHTLRKLKRKYKIYKDSSQIWIFGSVVLSAIVIGIWIFFNNFGPKIVY